MLNTLGKNFSRKHFEIFFLRFPRKRFNVSNGDDLHEMSKPVFWEKVRKTFQYVDSAETFTQTAKH